MNGSEGVLLGFNIDHCATVRQARYRGYVGDEPMVEPDPVTFALLGEEAGADGITVHLREDQRHIQERDVRQLRERIATRLNLEMACTPGMTRFALDLKPDSVCLVPENRQEVTTEGGLDVCGQRERVAAVVEAMNGAGIATSLFIDPDPAQVEAAAELGSPWIELHTGRFANAWYGEGREAEWQSLRAACEQAHALGLVVNAGHGINYENIGGIMGLPRIHELNIGHSIVSRALYHGVAEAVMRMKTLMRDGAPAC